MRDEGDRITLGFKQRTNPTSQDGSSNDGGMDEVEVVVSDFERTALMLEKIGLKQKFYEENRRVRWTKGEVEFDIDYWPELKPYLEIEAKSWEQVDAAIAELGLDPADKRSFQPSKSTNSKAPTSSSMMPSPSMGSSKKRRHLPNKLFHRRLGRLAAGFNIVFAIRSQPVGIHECWLGHAAAHRRHFASHKRAHAGRLRKIRRAQAGRCGFGEQQIPAAAIESW